MDAPQQNSQRHCLGRNDPDIVPPVPAFPSLCQNTSRQIFQNDILRKAVQVDGPGQRGVLQVH